MKRIFLYVISASISMLQLSVTAQTTYNPPKNVTSVLELSEGQSQVTLSWEQPAGTEQSEDSGIIFGTTVYNSQCKLALSYLQTVEERFLVINDTLVFQAFEYFNNTIYAIEAQTCVGCGGGIIENYNMGIIDPVEGAFDVMMNGIFEDPTGMAWNPVTGKVYISMGTPDIYYQTNFGTLNLSNGLYDPVAYLEFLLTFTIDNEGICYALTYDNEFGTIDLTTGDFTKITTLPVPILMKHQNLAIDRYTNNLYWAARLVGSNQCPLYQIDKTTGDLTVVGYFPEGPDFQVQSFAILSFMAPMYHVYRDGEKLTDQPISTLTYTDTNVTENETYLYCVTAIYDYHHESDVACKSVAVCNVCQPIQNVTATVDAASPSVTIAWEYAEAEATFDLYRNNVFVENTTALHYTDYAVSVGESYVYCVILAQQCCEEVKKCSAPVELPTNIAEKATLDFAVFPNPASQTVTVRGKNMAEIVVYNSLGQSVARFEDADDEMIYDVSLYPEGVYFLQIRTKDNVSVSKRLLIVS